MATQSFRPENMPQKKIKSQNIRTPGVDRIHRGFLVRMLIIERIRCILDDVSFNDNPKSLIEKHVVIPPHYKDQEQKDRYLRSEMAEIMAAFHRFEENPQYQEDIKALLPYRGHIWHLASSSNSGVLLTIEV